MSRRRSKLQKVRARAWQAGARPPASTSALLASTLNRLDLKAWDPGGSHIAAFRFSLKLLVRTLVSDRLFVDVKFSAFQT
eukprot:6122067-Pleurochrysis_carterae.AAC.1